MSSPVGEAIRLCRDEELKLTQTIRQYKDILRSMKTHVKDSSEAETSTSVKHDVPLEERQEVELLEQALKKAFKIRSSSAVSAIYQEKTFSSSIARNAPAVNDSDKRNPQKSSLTFEVKGSWQRGEQLKRIAARGDSAARQDVGKTVPLSQPTIKGKQSGIKPFLTQKTTRVNVQIKPCQMTRSSLEPDRGVKNAGVSSTEERTSSDQQIKMQSVASSPKEQWVPSPFLPSWQTQRAKKNKLWNKVLTRHSKAVPERDHSKKRLISTFPTEWASVHKATMEAELDVLTQLGLDLTHCYNAELQSHQMGWSPEPSTEKEYESLLMLAGLEKMMGLVIKEAGRLKKDWERKMAWWHGALCPLRSRVEWHISGQPCLPPLLAYSSKVELEDLHSLRLQVAQLKLEIHMHQAMCDALLYLISDSSSSGHLSATALRGVYSLLGEGGAQFPSLVLDIDSVQT
ncbi:tubulin epsilon and delta complex protein 2 [Tachysurus fulvidraco]|uniref:tubulin epsilon and delta complex protein 2 n=1 Tax=Tachysurus fulvidraco TaxID=1234273 RepID=UPI001FEE6DB1|nr:tubulin epsilon and delta complex protein 2 [Tachysurus fulvidraco]